MKGFTCPTANRLGERKIEMKSESQYPMMVYPTEEGGYVAEVPALGLFGSETLIEVWKSFKKCKLSGSQRQNVIKRRVPSAAQVVARLRKMVEMNIGHSGPKISFMLA